MHITLQIPISTAFVSGVNTHTCTFSVIMKLPLIEQEHMSCTKRALNYMYIQVHAYMHVAWNSIQSSYIVQPEAQQLVCIAAGSTTDRASVSPYME